MISYVMPTRDRPAELSQTLARIGALNHLGVRAEVVIVDNASRDRVRCPRHLPNGLPVRVIRLDENRSAAARNVGVSEADGDWIVMLDDDSYPLSAEGIINAINAAPMDIAAIGAEIFLGGGTYSTPLDVHTAPHEAGGLPEVIIGCGALIRRDRFIKVGGYDASFDYYAEEYDLCAKLLLQGWRVGVDRRFQVVHEKVASNRNFGHILRRLVRNSSVVAMRYAPRDELGHELKTIASRYAQIARSRRTLCAYGAGIAQALACFPDLARRPMTPEIWGRFIGLDAARVAVARAISAAGGSLGPTAIVQPGKNASVVTLALREHRVELTQDPRDARTLVIGTMSPGPMLDALRSTRLAFPGVRVVAPWLGASEHHANADSAPASSTVPARLLPRYAAAS